MYIRRGLVAGIAFCILAVIFFIIGWQIYNPLRIFMNNLSNIVSVIVVLYFAPLFYMVPMLFMLYLEFFDIFIEIILDIMKQLLAIPVMYYLLPLIGLINQILGGILLAISAIYFRRFHFANKNTIDKLTKNK